MERDTELKKRKERRTKMTIEKAIEIIERDVKGAGKTMPHDCQDALNLGIEALHRCAELRKYTDPAAYMALRGETEE